MRAWTLLHEFYVDGIKMPGTNNFDTWNFILNALSNITPKLRATVVGLRMLSPMTTSVRLCLPAELGVVITSISVLMSLS